MLADDDIAQMELDAARWVFQQLGAEPEVARLDALELTTSKTGGASPSVRGLTGREIEVLAQVATGKTNRAIAVFTKLGLSSRGAATAYAYETRPRLAQP
jgi:DNA-binding NarL/FixJ family response regulator